MKVLTADMWPGVALGDPNGRYREFLNVARPRFTGFIESILLYDQIVVPTDDFVTLTLLVDVLGEKSVIQLIDDDILRFVRFIGTLAYVGNGGGLLNFRITDKKQTTRPAWGPTDAAVDWALEGLNKKVDIRKLLGRALENTREIDLATIMPLIREQTYHAVLDSAELRAAFSLRNTDMSHLAGVEPNGVRIYAGVGAEVRPNIGDEIDTVLAFARAYLEKYAASDMSCEDTRTATPIGYALGHDGRANLATLKQFTNIPDIGELVLSEGITIKQLLKLRRSRDWSAFRDWFHEACRKEPMHAAKEYVDLLKQVSLIERAPAKIIRLLITTAIGIYNVPAGIAAAGADTFGSSKIRGASAKYFIERLEQLTNAQKTDPK